MGRWLSVALIVSSLAGCSDDVTARKFRFETVTVAGDLGSARTPFVFYDGYYLQVVWSEDRGPGPDLYIQSFDSDGKPVGHARRITESHRARRPVVAQIGDAFLIAWTDRVDGMLEVMAAGLNPQGGELLSAVNVSNDDLRVSHSPRLVELGGKPVLFYKERLADEFSSVHRMVAAELDIQGRPDGDPQPFWQVGNVPYNPAVATSGRTLMIVSNLFSSSGEWIMGFSSFVSLKMLPETPSPIETEGSPWAPDIASIGKDFLVACRNNGGLVPSVEVIRVESSGEQIGAVQQLDTGADFIFEPSLASDGDRAVVIWREELQGQVDLVGRQLESGDRKVLAEGAGLGDPASALLIEGNLCVAWETVLEGIGSVQVGCFEAPGGGF